MLLQPLTLSARYFPDSYDGYLKDAATRYIAPYLDNDWRWFKAQCYQESLLNPKAVSHAGAQGLCQIMPATWREQSQRMGIKASPFNPRANALVGAAYMRRMFRGWTTPRHNNDLRRWAWSAYNCGFGCALDAQRRSGGAVIWTEIDPYLPTETRIYIRRIERWYWEMNKP